MTFVCFMYIVYGNAMACLEIPASNKFHSLSITKDWFFTFSDVNTLKNSVVRKAFKMADFTQFPLQFMLVIEERPKNCFLKHF